MVNIVSHLNLGFQKSEGNIVRQARIASFSKTVDLRGSDSETVHSEYESLQSSEAKEADPSRERR